MGSFWVALPRLWSDVGAWSVRLNDSEPSLPAAGQEDEEALLPKSVQTDALQTRSSPQAACSQDDSTERREELSDIWAENRTEAIPLTESRNQHQTMALNDSTVCLE